MNTPASHTLASSPSHNSAHTTRHSSAAQTRSTRAQAVAVLTSTVLAMLLTACGGGGDAGPAPGAGAMAGPQSGASAQALRSTLATLPAGALSADETAGLLLMREEEKLAHDVYVALYSLWGASIFDNISTAEQSHMDSVRLLLDRYALPDPADTTAPGRFSDPGLQHLYDSLMAAGRTSVVAALKVGAEIEDVDIRDLRALKAATDKADLLLVYDNLERGSRNHLRAFHTQLQAMAASYTPQYLTQAEYDAIVSTPQERGKP